MQKLFLGAEVDFIFLHKCRTVKTRSLPNMVNGRCWLWPFDCKFGINFSYLII